MSPRAGGEADKVGNRYEAAWTVRHLLYVLHGEAQSITVEDAGDLAEGSEFTYRRGDTVEVHQVKRQNGNANSWTVKTLHQKQVWKNARAHIEAGRHFRFVSLLPARPIQELADRARSSNDLDSYLKSGLSKKLVECFDELTSVAFPGSPEVAWQVLRGFWIEWHDERALVTQNSVLAELLLECPAGKLASAALVDIMVNNSGVTLDVNGIETRLAEYRIHRVSQIKGQAIFERVASAVSGWAESIERELLQPSIDRPEAEQLARLVEDDDKLLLVVGAAGGGKSAVLQQVFRSLEAASTPVLAFRLDRLDPFSSTLELGNRIGFDVSPVAALATVAGDRSSVLIVDQLDAVSLASGRMPDNFDAVANLVREASVFPNMRVVLACRKFDVDNDHRIRELVNEKVSTRIEVGELSESQVIDAVNAMGLSASALDTRQKTLLRTPLNLVLLKSIADEDDALSFQSSKHLFDKFWERKLGDSRRRRASVRYNKVISVLAGAISARQRLSVPVTVLDTDDLLVDAGVLVSEHVLVRDGQQVAFFHESFFDYAFARGWIERNETLVDFLASGEQELFRRAQVRQILNHLRDLEPDKFTAEVESLLTSADVRYHIKDVVIAIVGALQEPTPNEWEMVAEVLDTHPSYEDRLWLSLQTEEWFKRLDAEGLIEAWLATPDESRQSRALKIMTGAVSTQLDRLAELLRLHTGKPNYPHWLRWIAQSADVYQSRPLFDLILQAVRQGQYEDAAHELWLSVHDLGKHQATWAVELLAAYLIDRPGALALDTSNKVAALVSSEHSLIELVELGSIGAPQLFCDLFLPYMLHVMAATEYEPGTERPLPDQHFSHRYPNLPRHDLDDAILAGAASAIRSVVEQDPESARPMLETLAADPHEAAQWLLYEGIRAAGETFAQWAANLFLEGSPRFLSGYSSNSVWTARQVIQATSSFMSDDSFHRLKEAILAVRFSWEVRRPGWYMFNLLSAMDESRLSEVGRRRLGELRRAAGMDQPPEPEGIRSGFIGPPISGAAAEHMNDDQWLRAIAKHAENRTNWSTFRGGAQELSSVLQEKTKENPERFARLALRLTAETHPAYGDAILLGLGEAQPLDDPSSVFAAVRHIASLGQAPNDRWLGHGLSLDSRVSRTPKGA